MCLNKIHYTIPQGLKEILMKPMNLYFSVGSAMLELKVTARSYPVVLVRCDGSEAGLLKDKCFIVLLRVFLTVLAGIHVNHVKPGLVAVH